MFSLFFFLIYKSHTKLINFEHPIQTNSSAGCVTSVELFWKLNTLQNFIHDLHWPDEVFGNHLEQRLKLMACDMIETSINQTMQAFQLWERKGNRWTVSTDYIIPTEMCTMINLVLESRNQSLKLCTFNGHDTVCF